MSVSDRTLGCIGLLMSAVGLGYLFVRLMIIPILPLDEGDLFNLSPPISILMTCGLCGFVFVGSLSIYTIYVLYKSDIDFKHVKTDSKFSRN